MSVHISINWSFGRPHAGADEDEARASYAAWLVLGDRALEAQAEYRRQWEEYDDEEKMTGLARLFIEAREAADRALTQGWHNPDGAGCEIEVWTA